MDGTLNIAPVLYEALISRLTYHAEIEFWDISSTSWRRLAGNAPWDLDPKYTTVCIRAGEGVGFTPGLGWEISQLEHQHVELENSVRVAVDDDQYSV